MTTRSKIYFQPFTETWEDGRDTYAIGKLTRDGWDRIRQGVVGKQYTVRVGAGDKVDAPNPPFTEGEGGHWND